MKVRVFLPAAIILMMSFVMSCTTGTSDSERDDDSNRFYSDEPIVMILKNRADTVSVEVADEVTQSLMYSKIPFQSKDLGLLTSDFSIPETVRLLCITTSELEGLKDAEVERIVRFVAEGNTIIAASPVWDSRMGFLQGIKRDSDYSINREASEFKFKENVFPKFSGKQFRTAAPLHHFGINGSAFKRDIEIIATAINDTTYPAILRNDIGLGKVLLFNTLRINEKFYRGILFSAITSGLSGIAYPVVNVATIFLDDFPTPLYNEKLPPIDKEYDITHAEFIAKKWWPDMKAFADTFNIDYSAMTAFNYNANVVPPFDFNEWRSGQISLGERTVEGSIWLAKDVAETRHELAFHGYNHFSLWKQDWPNEEFMVLAVQAAKKRWVIDGLGSLPTTYVPPTNEIDSLGLVSVKKGMPSIRYMASLYIGDIEDGGGREFGPDPYVPNLFNYPRISSGFYNFDSSVFEQNSLYQLTGIWTHFVHPDDVFQVEQREEDEFTSRNRLGLGWHESEDYDYGLYEVFRERVLETKKRYPFIRFLAAKDAAPIVKDWVNSKVDYTFSNNTISYEYTYKSEPYIEASTDTTTYWFMYVDTKNTQRVLNQINKFAEDFFITDYWDGNLIQFSTKEDSLAFPDLSLDKELNENSTTSQRTRTLQNYRSYIAEEDDNESESMDPDERFEYALSALNKNPDSKGIQERVIQLAVEQEQVGVAIKVLERRLLNAKGEEWNDNDINRLFTYYGWENRINNAWGLLNRLWAKNQDDATIAAKDELVEMYSYPDEGARDRWLERELAINTNDDEALRAFIKFNQTQESWPRTKGYLKQLINLNRRSDSLYHYTLQRSFYYDEPRETIELLESFPETAHSQLKPLAQEIASLYAYSVGNYTEALQWSSQAHNFPVRTELEWLLQQKRYKSFMDKGNRYLAEHPADDSTRAFIGQQLIYEGFYQQGYETIYPLFEEGRAPEATKKLVHTEIGYMSYTGKKSFYKKYPSFYPDSLKQSLKHNYRLNEGVKGGLTGSYASDNFENNIARIGLFAEWGDRQKYTHHVSLGETFVSSDIIGITTSDELINLGYRYSRRYSEGSMQSTIGAGLYYWDREISPDAELGFWYAKDSTFTSGEVTLEPVLTNAGIQQDINHYKASLYREDYWGKGRIQTTLSVTGSYYSDDVFSFEALGRIYVQLPFSTAHWRYRSIGELSYSDATVSNNNGIPYYTPNELFIEGVGIDFRYRDLLQNPGFSLELELMGKNDSRDGLFLTSAARLNAKINNYWELSFNADISSSSVYRYNNFGFTLSYIFPRTLPNQ